MRFAVLLAFLILLPCIAQADDAAPASAPPAVDPHTGNPLPSASPPAPEAAPAPAAAATPAPASAAAPALAAKTRRHHAHHPNPADASAATADQAAGTADLSAQDKADVARIEKYLNNLKSIAADFMQIDDRGGTMRGQIAIKRPGKMRVTYSDPNKDFIVADGDMVHIWDNQLRSQTNVEESDSLANLILRENIVLSGDVTITQFRRFPAKMEVTLRETTDPGAGQLTLVFEDHPLILRQWKVLDPQGRVTGVNLENEQTDVEFPGNMFDFVAPNFGLGGKARDQGQGSGTSFPRGG